MAEVLRNGNVYHLRNDKVSYVLMEMPGGTLAHLYFGARRLVLSGSGLTRAAWPRPRGRAGRCGRRY